MSDGAGRFRYVVQSSSSLPEIKGKVLIRIDILLRSDSNYSHIGVHMKKGQVLLITSILLMNVLLILPSLISTPVEALDVGMDTDLSASDASFWGEDSIDFSGISVVGAGDVNGDGYDDILIGAHNNDEGGSGAGQTYLIFGKASSWAMDTDLSTSSASFLGEGANDYSGNSVAGAGDVNGDGYDDILIGADRNNDGGGDAGQTYLIFGKASGWAMDTDLSASDASFWGENQDDYSGTSVSGAGDVNGDGYDDILIGADGNDDGGTTAGQTYLILGKPSGWAMDASLSASDASFWGEDGGDQSGGQVSGAEDVNVDGYDDILIGAHRDWDSGNIAGQTYLILGKDSGWTMDTDLSASDASFWGENAEDQSGISVSSAGDVNGDGYDDILVGALGNDNGGNTAGQTYLILGKISGWSMDTDLSASDASFWGEDTHDRSGYSVAGVGDVNGDGYDDILIGAYGNKENGNFAGQTYLILGKVFGWVMDTELSTSEASFQGEDTNDYSGISVAGAADINGDGYDDILIGAYKDSDADGNAGQTYLIFPDHNSKPTSITSVKAYSDDEYSHEITSADVKDKVYIEMSAQDTDVSRANIALVNVTSNERPQRGFSLRLHETGVNTGIYRGNITIANRTHKRYCWINATEEGWVNVYSRQDPSKFVNLTIGQRINIDPKLTTVYTPEDSFYTQQFEASIIVPDSWSFDTNASWLAWDPETKEISGTPNNSHIGIYWVELLAEAVDANGLLNFTIQVNNTTPVITTQNVLEAHEGQDYIVDYNSTDDGQGIITWRLDTTANWLHMNTTSGVIKGTPGSTDVGTHTVNISVDDGNGGWDFTEYELEVIEINDPPELLSFTILPEEIFRGQSSVFYIEASDPENGTEIETPVVEVKSEVSGWQNVECSYNFAGDNFTGIYQTNSSSEKGKYSFRVKLTDKFNISGNWHYFNDTLLVLNNPPVFNESFTNLTAYSDQSIIIDLTFYGTDYEEPSSSLTWEVEEYSPSSLFDAYMKDGTRVEIWPASVEKSGLGKIEFKITDNDGGVNFKNITVEIVNASTRPDISIGLTSPGNETIIPNSTTNLTWSVGDYDGKISYDIYLGDSISNMTLVSGRLDEQMFEATDLIDGTIYYWQVVAKVEGVPGIYESDIYNFEVQFGFEEEHILEINFVLDSVEVKLGDFVMVNLTLKNLGNVREIINLDVISDLADSVSMDDTVGLDVGEEKTIIVKIFAQSKLVLKTYNLTVKATFALEEFSASIDVKVVGEAESVGTDNKSKSWTLYIIAVILFLTIVAILIFLILRSKKKKEDNAEAIEAEIEGRSRSGITKADLDMLAIGGTPHPGAAPFQGRLSYNLPGPQQTYQHKPLAPAPQVTLPQLKVTGAVKEQPKALPQTSVVPVTGVPATIQPTLPVCTPAVPTAPVVQALPMVGSVPTAPITPSVTVAPPASVSITPVSSTPIPTAPVPTVPLDSPPSEPLPPPDAAPPPPDAVADKSTNLRVGLRKKPSFLDVKHTMMFKMEDSMPCSICYGSISEGLQAIRCNCGNIGHVSCGIKVGKCPECGTGYGDIINRASEEAIIQSVADSQKTAKREVELTVEWDEKGDMMKGLLKQLLNKEITIEQYQAVSKDIKETF